MFATDCLDTTPTTPLTVMIIVPPAPGAMAWLVMPKKFFVDALYVQLNLLKKVPDIDAIDSGLATYSPARGKVIFNPTDPEAIDVVIPALVKNTVNVVVLGGCAVLFEIGDVPKLMEVIAGSASF